MSLNIKTGAYWERRDQKEDEDTTVGQSQLFLNRQATSDFRINEVIRKKAYKQFIDGEKKTGDDNDEGNNKDDSVGDNGGEEQEITVQLKAEEEVDEATMRKRRKVFK